MTAACGPPDGEDWEWERLHLCAEPFLEDEAEDVVLLEGRMLIDGRELLTCHVSLVTCHLSLGNL